MDLEDFNDKRDELCLKYRNQFVAEMKNASLQRQEPTKTAGNSE